MMHNTGMTRVCTNALRLLRPPDDPTDEFLEKLGRYDNGNVLKFFCMFVHVLLCC